MAGGNEATALVAVLGCTSASWLITPLWLAATAIGDIQLDPIRMMLDLALTLIVPVALGQWLRQWARGRQVANERRALLSAISQLFVLAIVLKTAAQVGARLQSGAATPLLPYILLAQRRHGNAHCRLVSGLLFGGLLRFDRPRCIAIAFSGSQKTLPVSVYLFEAYFETIFPLAIIPLLFFHVGQLLFDTIIAQGWRKDGERMTAMSDCRL